MPELAQLSNYVAPQANLGALISPNLQVPQLQQLHIPTAPTPAYGDIGKAIAAGIEAHQRRQDEASARLAADTVNRQFAQSQGVDTSGHGQMCTRV